MRNSMCEPTGRRGRAGLRAAALAGCGALAMAFAPPAAAQKETLSITGEVTGSLAFTTDYRFRGISQTFRDPAIQGGLEFTTPGRFYVGTWASIVDKLTYANSRGFEWDIYGGYRAPLGGAWTLDVGAIQYLYPSVSRYGTLEAYAGVSYDWLSFKYYYALSNRFFGTENARGSQYFDLTAAYPLREDLTLIGHIGNQLVSGNSGDYIDYRVGLTKQWRGFDWSASIYGTDVDAATTNIAGRTVQLGARGLVLAISKTF